MSKISTKNNNRLTVPQSPVVLAILDGWGYREDISDNAIKKASTPSLLSFYFWMDRKEKVFRFLVFHHNYLRHG